MPMPASKNKAPSRHPIIISHDSIITLLKNDATATQICAFIVISACRPYGNASAKCGYDAISKCVGIGFERAKKVVGELLTFEVDGKPLMQEVLTRYENWMRSVHDCPELYDRASPDGARTQVEYLEENKEKLQKRMRSETRWKGIGLNVNGSIWLDRSFVGNKLSKDQHPVYRLNRRKNDVAAKLLMMMYACNDLVLNGVAWSSSVLMEPRYSTFGNAVYFGKLSDAEPNANVLKWLFLLDDEPAPATARIMWEQVFEALDLLKTEKLVKEAVVVDVWNPQKTERICCYDLHVKGERYTGSLRDRINGIAADAIEQLEIRSDCRSHDGRYYALAPEGTHVELTKVYRLSYVATVGDCRRLHTTRNQYKCMALAWADEHVTLGRLLNDVNDF